MEDQPLATALVNTMSLFQMLGRFQPNVMPFVIVMTYVMIVGRSLNVAQVVEYLSQHMDWELQWHRQL